MYGPPGVASRCISPLYTSPGDTDSVNHEFIINSYEVTATSSFVDSQQGVMSREMSETDHRVLAAPLDPERHACRSLHHDMAFSLKGLRPMSKAML